MKPRSREITIFSLSTLDVIFGALGAFMILMLSLLPSYGATSDEDAAELQRQLEEARAELERAEADLQEAETDLRESEDRRRMLFVIATWDVPADVDLWMEQPGGRLSGPKPADFPGREVFQTSDITDGPGTERIALEAVGEGRFTIFLRCRRRPGTPATVTVRGAVVANQLQAFQGFTMTPVEITPGQSVIGVVVTANAEGTLTIDEMGGRVLSR